MATKKTPLKQVKKPVKKSAPVAAKSKPAPAKKSVPAKKVVVAKKAPAKAAAKKVVAKPTKPVAKKVVAAKSKPAAKAVTKVVVKPVAKNVKSVVKPVVKAAAKSSNKRTPVASAKKVVPQKPVKQLPKKIETKKVAPKAQPVKKVPTKVAAVKSPAKVVEITKPAPRAAPAKPVVQKPVVLPKINTKTSRKYEPDFTKSVLDKAPADAGAPIVMYGDADLAEFKELIQRKLGSAKKELAYLQGLITRKDDMGGDEGDGRYMTMEDGSLSMEREQISQMASRQITFVDHLEKALMRIENKTYGVCRITGKLIDKARLRAVPHATLSIEAKMSGGR